MKLTKRKVWIFGMSVAAAVVAIAFLNRRSSDQLTVRLVDKTGKPMTCAVNVAAYHAFYAPIWSERFLERYGWFRQWFYDPKPERSSYNAKGTFQIKRLSNQNERRWYVITIRSHDARPEEEVTFRYQATINGQGEISLSWPGNVWDRVELEAGQKEVTIPIELAPARQK